MRAEWFKEFFDGKGAFYNGNESNDSGNNNENYKNNEQQQLSGFPNSCYKIVSPVLLQKLINNFAIWDHYSGTLLLVEDVSQGFGN